MRAAELSERMEQVTKHAKPLLGCPSAMVCTDPKQEHLIVWTNCERDETFIYLLFNAAFSNMDYSTPPPDGWGKLLDHVEKLVRDWRTGRPWPAAKRDG